MILSVEEEKTFFKKKWKIRYENKRKNVVAETVQSVCLSFVNLLESLYLEDLNLFLLLYSNKLVAISVDDNGIEIKEIIPIDYVEGILLYKENAALVYGWEYSLIMEL